MAGDARLREPGQQGIYLSNGILPVWNIVAICLILVASVATLLVFSADAGRYVPTGSVIGFQGPSYFYITGFLGFIVSVCWCFSTAGKLKRLSISAREDGALLVRERVIGACRELAIPAADLKAFMFKRYPSAGHVAWFIIALGWLAFIIQLVVPNFQLPFVEFPVVATTLLVFGGCMVGTAVIGVARPGLDLLIVDVTARHVIKMPGVVAQSEIISRITTILRAAGLVPSGDGGMLSAKGRGGQRHFIIVLGALCFIVIGIVNLAFLLAGSSSSVLNQGSSWLLVASGVLEIAAIKNRTNALPANSWVSNPDALCWSKPLRSPGIWLVLTGIAGSILAWYFVGASVGFDLASMGNITIRTALLGLVGISYTSWCGFACLDVSVSAIMNLDDKKLMLVRSFSITISESNKIPHPGRIHESWHLALLVATIVGIGTVFFFVGFLSFV